MGPSDTFYPGDRVSISRRSRLVAFLLAFCFGLFGIHRFYVGKTGSGIAQFILSLSVIGIFVSSPWVFIDWILILTGNFTDDLGLKLTRWDSETV